MRHKRWSQIEVAQIIETHEKKDFDKDGNARYFGHIRGQLVRVVVARDDPRFVITVHPRRHL